MVIGEIMFWDTGKVCLFLGFTNISVSQANNKTTVNQRKRNAPLRVQASFRLMINRAFMRGICQKQHGSVWHH